MSQPHFGQSGRMQLPLPKVETWSPPGLPKTQKTIWGVKSPCLDAFFISMKSSWSVDVQNGLALPIWTSTAQVMAKEGSGVKLPVWLPTTKSRESTSLRRCLKECDTALESSQWELQLWFRARPDLSLGWGAVAVQSPGTILGLQLGSLGKKRSFGYSLGEELQRIIYGGRWWLPLNPGHGESSSPSCPWLVPTPKGVLKCELTHLWLILDADSCLIF
jgi:hypothetical protein